MAEATSRPWKTDRNWVEDDSGAAIGNCYLAEDARLIVRAVNSFEAMKEALRHTVEYCHACGGEGAKRYGDEQPGHDCEDCKIARAVLYLAEKGE